MPLDARAVRTIDRYGGTHPAHLAHQSRPGEAEGPAGVPQGKFAAGRERALIDCTPHVLRVLEALKIDAMFADRRRRHALLRRASASAKA